VVADIPCNGNSEAWAPTGEPGALAIPHRNGKYCRHYVNSGEFFTATQAGGLRPISAQGFRNKYPCRGTDFRVFR
jgi:hypothetical protein